ncbi:MAG: CPBP family glutamic-type intramembrane protease [Pirellulaceae bacterium]|nr:CPBP family glutamic-type intramembrane protease [Pirellulaceae bacterium]
MSLFSTLFRSPSQPRIIRSGRNRRKNNDLSPSPFSDGTDTVHSTPFTNRWQQPQPFPPHRLAAESPINQDTEKKTKRHYPALSYWQRSQQPLLSLLFIAPLLFFYELSILHQSDTVRNGVDLWLRQGLSSIGLGHYYLLPLLTCLVLLGWHHIQHHRWKIDRVTTLLMVTEVVLASLILLGIAISLRSCFVTSEVATSATLPVEYSASGETSPKPLLTNIHTSAPSKGGGFFPQQLTAVTTFLGAGIYEEFFFRLLLLPTFLLIGRSLQLGFTANLLWAVFAESLLFAAVHYQIAIPFTTDVLFPEGYLFDWYGFTFRFLAGLYFSALFLARGFGIAVGVHACYDILTLLY